MPKIPEQQTQKTIVHIVDDDDGMRRALALLITTLGYETASYALPSEFFTKFKPDGLGCLVLDIRMPEMSGLEVQQELVRRGCMMPIIFITGHGDVPMAVQAMKAGAFEFIQKPFRDQDLLDKINEALRLDVENHKDMARRADVLHRLETLTPREKQVMQLVVNGDANKVIAIDLGLSERTVEIHRAKVMEKMGAKSVAHLVKMHMMLEDSGAHGQ